jgi:hypothetical protein
MGMQTWGETLASLQVDGTALTNSTTQTSLFGTSVAAAAAKYTIPANYFQIGRQLLIKAAGRFSNVTAAPGNFTFDLKFGSTVVFTSGAIAISTTVHTNVSFDLEVLLTCRAIGSGTIATLMGQGKWITEGLSATANIAAVSSLPVTSPVVGTGFDSTAAQLVDLFGTFSVANAANSITVHQYSLIGLN